MSSNRMSRAELQAGIGLSAIFGLRMLGMFVILPVFAIYAEQLEGGMNLTLVGIAIGAYGLTQALLQIPFGWLSDRYGRKPVIYTGLAIFAIGSFIAATATSIHIVIVGRILQGAGAISAAVMAMLADLTREQHRTKAMAMIGSTIGLTFALSLVASPWLNRVIGVPGIFALTGVLSIMAMGVVYAIADAPQTASRRVDARGFRFVLFEPQLARLNFGILVLQAVLMALFVLVPLSLRDAGLALDHHWQVYLPVMLGSFAVMVPAILFAERRGHIKGVFIASIAVLIAGQAAMPWLFGGVVPMAFFLLVFFSGFNVLEAMLPSLVSRLAPAHARGTAIGIFSSVQFLGTFIGAAGGAYLYQQSGARGVFVLDIVLLITWLLVATGMKSPAILLNRSYEIPTLDTEATGALLAALQVLPGVREARIESETRTAHLKVDAAGYDEQHVLRLIDGAA